MLNSSPHIEPCIQRQGSSIDLLISSFETCKRKTCLIIEGLFKFLDVYFNLHLTGSQLGVTLIIFRIESD
jgi:hypothetical protein